MRSLSSQSAVSSAPLGTTSWYAVVSIDVSAFACTPPTASTRTKCSYGARCSDPSNVRCSTKCAMPSAPGGSSAEPTS